MSSWPLRGFHPHWKMANFREEPYYINKYRVKQLAVVGKAAESFWSLAFHRRLGLSKLLLGEVTRLDLYNVTDARGRFHLTVTFKLEEKDSRLALRLAVAVATAVERHGFRIMDGVQSRLDSYGCVIGGEHDLVGERKHQNASGLSSIEVKCRQIKTSGLRLEDVRLQVQKETWKAWPEMKQEAGRDWAERVCVLVVWGAGDDLDLPTWTKIHAEAIPAVHKNNAPHLWEPLWGWEESLPAPSAPSARQVPSPSALQKARDKREAEIQAALKSVRRCTMHRKSMGSISDLLLHINNAKAKKVRPTIGQKMAPRKWPKKFGWTSTDYGSHIALGSRTGGGSPGHGGTDRVLRDILNFVLNRGACVSTRKPTQLPDYLPTYRRRCPSVASLRGT